MLALGVLAALVGLGGCATDVDELDLAEAPAAVTERLAPSQLDSIAIELPDEAGNLHRGVAVASRDIALHAHDLLAGARAIVRTDKKTDKAAGPAVNARMAYQQRTADARAAVANAAGSNHKALLAVVFEDSSVIGWRGVLRAAPHPAHPADSRGGHTYNDWINTTTASPVTPSTSVYCPAGAGAYGYLNWFSTTSTTIRMFRSSPFPLGTVMNPPEGVLLVNFGTTTYNWPNTYYGSWYYITSSQTPPPPMVTPPPDLSTAVTSSIACYWFGL